MAAAHVTDFTKDLADLVEALPTFHRETLGKHRGLSRQEPGNCF